MDSGGRHPLTAESLAGSGRGPGAQPVARSTLVRLMPMLVYTFVYAGTCLIGALLLLVGWDTFVAYYEYFSGTDSPQLTGSEVTTTLLLYFAAPVAMWSGFLALMYLRLPPVDRAVERFSAARLDARPAAPVITFAVSLAFALASLGTAGAFSDLGSWLHYADWITARQTIFARIGFFEFVNIYLLLPLSAAWIAVTVRPRGYALALIAVTAGLAIGVQLLLFQKKAAIVAALIVLVAIVFRFADSIPARRLRWAVLTSLIGVTTVYFVLVVLPVYERTRQSVQTIVAAEEQHSVAPLPLTPQQRAQRARLRKLSEELNLDNRAKALTLYTLLSPLTRTSAASLYYAKVFPEQHPFYGVGLGDGEPTDDTRVVWDYMNPNLPGGTVAAPFQFGMFALWGLVGALAACAAAGIGLALLWRVIIAGEVRRDWQCLGASLVILLALYLAIDSAQNSILVSYGIVWGLLFVAGALAVTAVVRFVKKALGAHASTSPAGNHPRSTGRG